MSLANEDVTVTDADRAKAAEIVDEVTFGGYAPPGMENAIAAALADARAEADQLRDAIGASADNGARGHYAAQRALGIEPGDRP